MTMCSLKSKGNKIYVLTNHFKVNVRRVDGHLFHYYFSLFYEDGCLVDGKDVERKVIDRVHETYNSELAGKSFVYDGENSLFTVSALNKLEFTIILDDFSSNKRSNENANPKSHDSPNRHMRKINVRTPNNLDWNKAKRALKNRRIKVSPSNQEYKITGLINQLRRDQLYSLKEKLMKNENGEAETL
ncbi:hypothetical protein REPUB_Repub07fG0067400 [Reevesia pubescens]